MYAMHVRKWRLRPLHNSTSCHANWARPGLGCHEEHPEPFHLTPGFLLERGCSASEEKRTVIYSTSKVDFRVDLWKSASIVSVWSVADDLSTI